MPSKNVFIGEFSRTQSQHYLNKSRFSDKTWLKQAQQGAFSFFSNDIDALTTHFLQYENYLFVGEIRLDNRDEIIVHLNEFMHQQSDAQVVLALYLKFGDKVAAMIEGDWWFVIYDEIDNSLFLAQDQSGYHSIYYYSDVHNFIFSSSVEELLKDHRVDADIRLDKILDLALITPDKHAAGTFFKNISLLNPAHKMHVSSRSLKRQRYWYPENIEIDYSISVEQASEELFSLLQRAIRVRTQFGPVASMLSGGLDSGSVVSLAAPELRKQNNILHTLSHVPLFDTSDIFLNGRTGDELPHMKSVVSKHDNIIPHYIDSRGNSPLHGVRTLNGILHEPVHGACNAYWLNELPQRAVALGCRTLLTGEMGNATISFTGYLPALSLRSTYKRLGVVGVTKKWLRSSYYTTKSWQSKLNQNYWQQYSYLSIETYENYDLKQRILNSGRTVDFKSQFNSHQDVMLKILNPGENGRYRTGSAIGNYFGIKFSDPTSDIRVIEYLLKLSNENFIGSNGEPKLLIKHMMKNRMPKEVLYQTSKGLQSSDITKRIQVDLPEIESIIHDFSTDLCEYPLFDKMRLISDLKKLRRYELDTAMTSHMLRSVGIMEFLRSHR